jgi:hypothetical protein
MSVIEYHITNRHILHRIRCPGDDDGAESKEVLLRVGRLANILVFGVQPESVPTNPFTALSR